MKSFSGFVVAVACTIGFGFATRAADERVNAATPSRESSSAKNSAEEKTEVLYTSPEWRVSSRATQRYTHWG